MSIPFLNNFLVFGVVEDIQDPEERGRVRVRLVGYHSEDINLIPTESLPWSEVSMPANNASLAGKGNSSNGLLKGTCVGGIFIDPEDKQEFLVLFSYPGKRSPDGDTNIGAFNAMGTEIYNDDNNTGCIPADPDTLTEQNINNNSTVANEPGNKGEPTSEPKWMIIAKQELDKRINEKNTPNRIREYHKEGCRVNYGATTPWCSSFVCWCLEQSGIRSTRSAGAISHNGFGGYKSYPVEEYRTGKKIPPYGSIVVIHNSDARTGSSTGNHVFFSMGKGGNGRVKGLHGNFSDSVKLSDVKASHIIFVGYPNGASTPDGTAPLQRNYNMNCSDVGIGEKTGNPINPSENEKALIEMMDKFKITNLTERRMLWAQCAAETGRFTQLKELPSKYNSSKGDYPGVGLLQITGEPNYNALSKKLGIPITQFAQYATASAKNAAEVSLLWWTTNSTNGNGAVRQFAQQGKLNEVSICVNAGAFGVKTGDIPNCPKKVHGMDNRIRFWNEIQNKDV